MNKAKRFMRAGWYVDAENYDYLKRKKQPDGYQNNKKNYRTNLSDVYYTSDSVFAFDNDIEKEIEYGVNKKAYLYDSNIEKTYEYECDGDDWDDFDWLEDY